jgi:hypothetical protein
MRWKVLQILLQRFRKWMMGSSLMEWMTWVTRSSGNSCIKHTAEKGGNRKATGLEIERRQGLKLAMRVEVEGDED